MFCASFLPPLSNLKHLKINIGPPFESALLFISHWPSVWHLLCIPCAPFFFNQPYSPSFLLNLCSPSDFMQISQFNPLTWSHREPLGAIWTHFCFAWMSIPATKDDLGEDGREEDEMFHVLLTIHFPSPFMSKSWCKIIINSFNYDTGVSSGINNAQGELPQTTKQTPQKIDTEQKGYTSWVIGLAMLRET